MIRAGRLQDRGGIGCVRIDVEDVRVERVEVGLVRGAGGACQGEQGLAAETALQGQDVRAGMLGDQGQAQGVFDGRGPAHGRQVILQAGQFLQPGGEILAAVAGAVRLCQGAEIALRVVAADAARDPGHRVKHLAPRVRT